jgi:hypothetical protein
MDTSTKVAVIALCVAGLSAFIAIASFGWTIYTAVRLSAARISVSVMDGAILGAGPRFEVLTATVTNVGRAPTKVQSLWFCVGRRPSRFRRLVPRRLRRRVAVITAGYDPGLSTKLPCILQPGDDATAVLPTDVARKVLETENGDRLHAMVSTSTAGSRRSRAVKVSMA